MKNLKNMLSAAALMVVLGVGAASANTGLIITDKSANEPCTVKSGFMTQLAGIIAVGMPMLDGLIITDRNSCAGNETDGLIITDRNGLIITD
jgi:hypothetical protein